jgi:hypothetical protein
MFGQTFRNRSEGVFAMNCSALLVFCCSDRRGVVEVVHSFEE